MEIFGTRNGLNSPKIYALAQATNRILWVGTESGISSFNGYEFENYQYTSDNKIIGRILCVAEDKKHNIWFGGDRGLFVFSGACVKQIEPLNGRQLALESLFTDSEGNIWVGDINSLFMLPASRIDGLTQSFDNQIELLPFMNFNNRAYSISEDSFKNLLLSTHYGLFRIRKGRAKAEVIWQNPEPENFIRSALTVDTAIYYTDDNGELSVCSNGLVSKAPGQKNYSLKIFRGKSNVFVLSTSGVSVLKKVITPLVQFGLSVNNVVTALEDAEGNLWIGSWEGLLKFRKTAFKQFQIYPSEHKEVFSFLETGSGQLLFGGNRGIVYESRDNKLVRTPQIKPLFQTAEVLCMYQTIDRAVWAGSGYEGVSRYAADKLQNWQVSGNLKDNNCEALLPSTNGKLLALTENGVTVIDPLIKNPFIHHLSFSGKYSRMPELFGGIEINGTHFFYGSSGLFRLKNNLLEQDTIIGLPLINLYINKMVVDKHNNLWMATHGKGLLKCRLLNNRVILEKQYTVKSGLLSDNILSVLVDKNQTIWVGDYMSVCAISGNNKEEQIIIYNEKDGLLSAYYQTLKLEQQKNGTIWGLTSMGAFSFHPDSMSNNTLAPALQLNAVSVAGLNNDFAGRNNSFFPYKHNSIRISYTAVSLTDPGKIRYAYRIKELDTAWTITSQRELQLNFLPSGRYTFELKACNNNKVWSKNYLTYIFSIKAPWWQTWWFRTMVVGIIALAVFWLYRRRIRIIKTRLVVKQQMAELESKALRAQMNPHFIFNSLNAIQELVVTENYKGSYEYLSKFSKLLRMVLHNSEKNFIPLSSEIEMNQLYLELESLRFEQSFRYSIITDSKIEPEAVLFPSLLLQPFIENAIWHGLMHKGGQKELKIAFTLTGDILTCTIEDNGVGRKKAAEIKAGKIGAWYFDSMGTKLARHRIENLQQAGIRASVETKDKYDSDGNPSGTLVEIKTFLKNKTIQ